jgi:hypothetical protein
MANAGYQDCRMDGIESQVPNYLNVDSRALGFSSFFPLPAKLGGSGFHLGTSFDRNGQPPLGLLTPGFDFMACRSRPSTEFAKWRKSKRVVESDAPDRLTG